MPLLSHSVPWDLAGGALGEGPGFPGASGPEPHQLAHLCPDFSITLCSLLCLDLSQPACYPGALQPVGPGKLGAAGPEPHSRAELGTAGARGLFHLCGQGWLGTGTASQGRQPGGALWLGPTSASRRLRPLQPCRRWACSLL